MAILLLQLSTLSVRHVSLDMQEEGWRPSITVNQILLGIQVIHLCTGASCEVTMTSSSCPVPISVQNSNAAQRFESYT